MEAWVLDFSILRILPLILKVNIRLLYVNCIMIQKENSLIKNIR